MFYFLLLGVCAGVLSGLLGIGGGIVLIPGLVLLFGFSQAEAQGTSLAVLIPPIGILAAIAYYQHGFVRLPVVAWVALGFAVGAYLGAILVPHVPLPALRLAFGALLLCTGFHYVVSSRVTQTPALLLAGVTTVASVVAAWLLGRSRSRRASCDGPVEYHI
jgi:uncharacterized membrane protein YfcA